MNQAEKRKFETQLMAMGLSGLDDAELFQAMADMISRWPFDRGQFLIDLMNECDAGERYAMYQALAPRLTFKAPSYIECETAIAAKASRMVSHRAMRVVGEAPASVEVGGKLMAACVEGEATQAMASVRCYACKRQQHFLGDTPAGAMQAARKAGWVREPGINKERCPDCDPALKTKKPRVIVPYAVEA